MFVCVCICIHTSSDTGVNYKRATIQSTSKALVLGDKHNKPVKRGPEPARYSY